MQRASRSTVALLITAAVLAGLHGWLRLAERADLSAMPVLGPLFLREQLDRQAEFRGRTAAAMERRRRARELAAEVAQGRLTLHEGADQMRRLLRDDPDYPWRAIEEKFPGASDEERCCRLLIGEVKELEGGDPEMAGASQRLEGDLERQLRQGPPPMPG